MPIARTNAQKTAFGEQEAAPAFAFIEGAATYGLVPANFREFTANGGSTGTENRMFKVSTFFTTIIKNTYYC